MNEMDKIFENFGHLDVDSLEKYGIIILQKDHDGANVPACKIS